MTDSKAHWEKVYEDRKPDEVSWFQANPAKSLEFVALSGLSREGAFIDVGGGASVLVDKLIEAGFKNLSVLDISAHALAYSKERLGAKAGQVHWYEKDVLQFTPDQTFDLWHDRAVFHFLTKADDRKTYVSLLKKSLKPGGHAILAPFASDGPEKCSGLDVCRYDAASILSELGPGFELIHQAAEVHVTPWDKEQKFNYFLFKRLF